MPKYLLFCILISACSVPQHFNKNDWRSSITAVLMSQQKAWNEGNIESFIDGYWKSDSLSFTGSGGRVTGWQKTLERYKRTYPGKAAMGQLTFEILHMDRLGPKAAVMLGRYTLLREKDSPSGLFTLVWKFIDGRWVIVSDHTC